MEWLVTLFDTIKGEEDGSRCYEQAEQRSEAETPPLNHWHYTLVFKGFCHFGNYHGIFTTVVVFIDGLQIRISSEKT